MKLSVIEIMTFDQIRAAIASMGFFKAGPMFVGFGFKLRVEQMLRRKD